MIHENQRKKYIITDVQWFCAVCNKIIKVMSSNNENIWKKSKLNHEPDMLKNLLKTHIDAKLVRIIKGYL